MQLFVKRKRGLWIASGEEQIRAPEEWLYRFYAEKPDAFMGKGYFSFFT